MGQKVHPTGIRLGIVKKHTSVWYAGSDEYADKLYTDLKVREYIQKNGHDGSLSPRKAKALSLIRSLSCSASMARPHPIWV